MFNHKFAGPQSRKLIRQIGQYAFIRYCRNIGMTFEETYFELFGRMPEKN